MKNWIVKLILICSGLIPFIGKGQITASVSCASYGVGYKTFGGNYSEFTIDSIKMIGYIIGTTPNGPVDDWRIYKVDLNTFSASIYSTVKANDTINTLLFRNDTLYFGGKYTSVSGNSSYKYFSAINANTGALLPAINANLNGRVNTMVYHKNRLFLGGYFSSVLGSTHDKIVSLSIGVGGLSVSTVAYPSDLTLYCSPANPYGIYGKISKMKSYGNYLFFILDGRYLYGFAPYPTGFPPAPFQFYGDARPSEGGPFQSVSVYDYDISGNTIYVTGNFMNSVIDKDINGFAGNYIGTTPGFNSKVVSYNYITGATTKLYPKIDSLSTNDGLYPTHPKDFYGCSFVSIKGNNVALGMNGFDYPSFDNSALIKTNLNLNLPVTQIDNNIYHWNCIGGGRGFDFYNNGRLVNNMLFFNQSHNSYGLNHCGIPDDYFAITRIGNASINGIKQNLGLLCKGDTVRITMQKQPYLKKYKWWYAGTGITIIDTLGGKDSARIIISYQATPGNLKLVAKDYFNQYTDTFSFPINFKPVPNINAGPNKYITCVQTSVNLKATTTVPSYNIDWITPLGLNLNDSLIGVTKVGTYYSRIKDLSTGCYGFDTIAVISNTVRPTMNLPVKTFSLTCKQTVITATAIASSPLDSVKWFGQPYAVNSATNTFGSAGKYYAFCLSKNNGCIGKDSINVLQSVALPPISSNVLKDSITCNRDSVLLDGSSNPGNIVFWKRPGFPNDSLPDPIYGKLFGFYTLIVRDTAAGCKSQLAINVANNKLAPYLTLTSNIANITCSQSFANLNASSPTPNTIINWQGPGGFISGNPATTTLTGTYSVTVTDLGTGCTKSDTVLVSQNNTLLMQSTSDTTICNGSSITVTANPIGGTAPFVYNWSGFGNATQINVSPNDTTKYLVTITDNSGCVGKDSVLIRVPRALSDSIVSIKPCGGNNGQLQVFMKGGAPPFQFSLNGGVFQNNNIFANLSYGNYTVSVKDTVGCAFTTTTQINNASLAATGNFIVATNLFKTDTFVVIDISNPKPDSVQWVFPATFTVINNTNKFAPVVMCSDTGYYNITQTVYFGSCQSVLNKQVHIKYNDGTYANSYNNNGIQNLTLYPNPNNGQFNVSVTLFKKQSFAIFITDANGIEKLRIPVVEKDTYNGNVILPNPAPGTYILKAISAYDYKYIVFVVTP